MARGKRSVEKVEDIDITFRNELGLRKEIAQPDAFEITKGEPFRPALVYCGAPGNVSVVTAKGATVTFHNVPAGTVLPVKCTQVLAKGTTADFGFVGIGE
jgi:hypothetical protein